MGNVFVEIYLEGGIIYFTAIKNFTIDLNVAIKIVEERLKLSQGNTYPVVMDLTKIDGITKDAMEYLKKQGSTNILAAAFITRSAISRIFVNIFLTIYNPNEPTKMFTDKEKAKKWAQQFTLKTTH